jgi:hypothetical protein
MALFRTASRPLRLRVRSSACRPTRTLPRSPVMALLWTQNKSENSLGPGSDRIPARARAYLRASGGREMLVRSAGGKRSSLEGLYRGGDFPASLQLQPADHQVVSALYAGADRSKRFGSPDLRRSSFASGFTATDDRAPIRPPVAWTGVSARLGGQTRHSGRVTPAEMSTPRQNHADLVRAIGARIGRRGESLRLSVSAYGQSSAGGSGDVRVDAFSGYPAARGGLRYREYPALHGGDPRSDGKREFSTMKRTALFANIGAADRGRSALVDAIAAAPSRRGGRHRGRPSPLLPRFGVLPYVILRDYSGCIPDTTSGPSAYSGKPRR